MSAAALPSVLLVDNDTGMRAMLRRYLGERGLNVQAIANVLQLERQLTRTPYDILLLDQDLPGDGGLALCRRLRADGLTLPIIMLNTRDDAADRIIGLEMGADDCMGRALQPRELVARINALLRRRQMVPVSHLGGVNDNCCFGPFRVSLSRMELSRDGEIVPLTATEFQLLRIFLSHPRRPLSRDQLLDRLKGAGTEASDRCIDVQVSRLRRKLERGDRLQGYLRTVWGVGYLFMPDGPCGVG
ncbi:winged helix-turn-helix domain-containing protein [Stenotrophomonas sp. NA06056]|uniref:winged helix-turn-helix domain-containing protein n=1 Tax=Stenotrophomonas sp. NA06056 TaxID=2742129 RepID=UPI00158E51DE|nr:winged helix-turn-helix domain-containing protein [Stenotrophomonas sp. NA06056]QKW55410.1 winged helix-turn-helix domain-containing protein [Stenotrophomonas sp. NA06056]